MASDITAGSVVWFYASNLPLVLKWQIMGSLRCTADRQPFSLRLNK
jgi:hypothetical protein